MRERRGGGASIFSNSLIKIALFFASLFAVRFNVISVSLLVGHRSMGRRERENDAGAHLAVAIFRFAVFIIKAKLQTIWTTQN